MSTNIFYSNAWSGKIWRSLSLIAHSFYLDREPDHTKAVLVCGAGRSGTTWLADLINATNDYRILYEPFNREQVPQCRHFLSRQYLRPYDDDALYVEPARAIFTGRIRNAWIDQGNRPMIARRRLIKDVRSTLMLKWVREHFPGMPIIFIMRHPCAVAISRVKLGWRTNLREVYFQQEALMSDHLAPFADEIERANTAFERHVIDWCVENYVPLTDLRDGDVLPVFYENLCADPGSELERLFKFLGRTPGESPLNQFNRPSITSRKKGEASAIIAGGSLVDSWRQHVSSADLSAAERITHAFGLDQIYGNGSFADASKARDLLVKGPVPVA